MSRSRVLILNSSYEPLQLTPVNSAVRLILRGKAEVLVVGEDKIHSERSALDTPLVIRLNRYVRLPFLRAACTRRGILLRDNFSCQYCGQRLSAHMLTLDHVIPRAHGGTTTWENVVAACKRCNSWKRDRRPEDARLTLQRTPVAPSSSWMLSRALAAHPVWSQYNVM